MAVGNGRQVQVVMLSHIFRIFNPISQSKRFDPNGDFIRKYLPELQNIPNKQLHFPHQYIADNKLDCYWYAIVDHKVARKQALDFYASINCNE